MSQNVLKLILKSPRDVPFVAYPIQFVAKSVITGCLTNGDDFLGGHVFEQSVDVVVSRVVQVVLTDAVVEPSPTLLSGE